MPVNISVRRVSPGKSDNRIHKNEQFVDCNTYLPVFPVYNYIMYSTKRVLGYLGVHYVQTIVDYSF